MKILVTGSARGIGKRVCEKYLEMGHNVYGIDMLEKSIEHENYTHFTLDIKNTQLLPEINDFEIIFNNAGLQNCEDDIANNLSAVMALTEKYIKDNTALKTVLFNASASATSGQEYPVYVASKAGLLGYMRNLAIRLAKRGVTVNALSPGGVLTESNALVMNDEECWKKIMQVTPLKKWMTVDEAAEWVIFLTLINKSMSGQNILVDNGEKDLNPTFVWPDYEL